MKIGLFGGTFDPIHLGHLRAVEEVSEKFGLAKTFLIPAARPPHKPHREISPASDRLEKMRQAVGSRAAFALTDIALRRPNPSYTVDTLNHFKRTAAERDYYLIMGLDAFLEIDTWKAYLEIFKKTPVIIMARPGGLPDPRVSPWQAAADFIRENLSDAYRITDAGACDPGGGYQPIHFIDVSLLDISGTGIRNLIRQGKSIQFLVPDEVEAYIRQRGLYQ